jgi:hypothetical protein
MVVSKYDPGIYEFGLLITLERARNLFGSRTSQGC